MKKFFFPVFASALIFAFANLSAAASLVKADELFLKDSYQQALKEYKAIFESSRDSSPERWKALFRTCESLAHLYRYGEAAQLLLDTQLPENTLFKARILILRTEIFRNFLQQYSAIQSQDIIDDDNQKDIFKLAPDEIRKIIEKDYLNLWELRNDLIKLNLKKEDYYINIKEVDFGMYPTLFDYLILHWTRYILEKKSNIDKDELTDKLLVGEFKTPLNFDDTPTLIAAELMEIAGRFKTNHRIEASERWKIERLLLGINMLYGNKKELIKKRNIAKEILLNYSDNFRKNESKAQAAYQAARLMNLNEDFVSAVELCKKINANFSGTFGAKHCYKLKNQIELPTLALEAKAAAPPGKDSLIITSRNLKNIFFRTYKIDPEKLQKENQKVNKYSYGWSQILSSPDQKWLEEYIARMRVLKSWNIETDDKGDYKILTSTVTPEQLTEGIYLILACENNSFKFGSSLINACFLNITKFVLVSTVGPTVKSLDAYYSNIEKKDPRTINDQIFRFYTFDSIEGEPLEGCSFNLYTNNKYDDFTKIITNEDGFTSFSQSINTAPNSSNSIVIDPLAQKGNSYCFLANAVHFSYYPPNPIQIFIQTDRPIYRPGHKVHVKVIATKRVSNGYRALSNQELTLTASDPNNKEFFKESSQLNDFGSATFSFEIPHGRLLGNYSIGVNCTDGRFSNNEISYFSVEEYKRPEFEILLKKSSATWEYNIPSTADGSVKYYFGQAVQNAVIDYRIKRQQFIPWFYRYWYGEHYNPNIQEITSGTVKSDNDGNFSIPFTPAADTESAFQKNIPEISQFIVEVDARDSGGRSIQSQEIYKASKSGFYFIIEPKKGFFLENEKVTLEAKYLTVNDTPLSGKTSYKVFRLKNTETKPLRDKHHRRYGGHWGWIPPIDVQLKDIPNSELVSRGSLEHDANGIAAIAIKNLSHGTYRITLTAADESGESAKQDTIFVVAKNSKVPVPVPAASVTLAEKDEYEVGETARCIIGSGLATGIYALEIWTGEHFLEGRLINTKKAVQLIELPITEKMKGGFTIRWFGVKDLETHHGQTYISVPWTDKKLDIKLNPFKKKIEPGEQITWGIQINDTNKTPQQAEALVLMYDRSLEYYSNPQDFWLNNLYAPKDLYRTGSDSVFDPQITNIRITEGVLNQLLQLFRQSIKEPRLPGLRFWRSWPGGLRDHTKMLLDDEAGAVTDEITAFEYIQPSEDKFGSIRRTKQFLPAESGEKITTETPKEAKSRNIFADTAFFRPFIRTAENGKSTFSFTAPEQLTSWHIKAFAFTPDIKEGVLVDEAITQKELMVRVDIPRFFREKDIGSIDIMVHNESSKKLNGELSLEIKENNLLINDKLNLKNTKRKFSIKPHSLSTFSCKLEIPEGVTTYKIIASAKTKKLSDAEERVLPILPSRQRLVKSKIIALQGDESEKLEIKFKDDPTRINESITLQIEPQLALTILNTIPFLIEYPYQCVEQILNKYVPLEIMNQIYKEYPVIKKAVKKIPERKTETPAWEKDDPNRLIKLMETPWIWQSEGRPTSWPLTDILDPKIVNKQKEITLKKLEEAQTSEGAFPWWPGGAPDLYITLYVLAGFAEVYSYGIPIPEKMVEKALYYVNKEIPLRLKPEPNFLALVSYAAYILTSFPEDEFNGSKIGFRAANSWVVFLNEHKHALTPLGKAYLAYTYLRLGNKEKADELLDMAMDGAVEDETAGVYWTPEKYSWIWYSDTVEKHAFLLRTLQELRPDDKRIKGMVQWLLFNRKGNVWKSTKSSAAAVFALLNYLNKTGALSSEEEFNINWGGKVKTVIVKADDWLEKPIRFQKEGFDVTDSLTSAAINKKGPGFSFASLTWTYSTDELPELSEPGMIELHRTIFRRVKEGDKYRLKPVKMNEKVYVGDQIEVHLKINTRSQFEYMHLKDPKASGFESETLLSGWKYDSLIRYEEPRDSLTNFFISWLSHGEYILKYRLKPTKPGTYRLQAATLQSMYSPDMTAHSAGLTISVNVKEKE
ncbi:MAG: MG2 domain-containing protein [bacterium]